MPESRVALQRLDPRCPTCGEHLPLPLHTRKTSTGPIEVACLHCNTEGIWARFWEPQAMPDEHGLIEVRIHAPYCTDHNMPLADCKGMH